MMNAISSSWGANSQLPSTQTVRTTIPAVLHQHAESSAALRQTRSVVVRAPHVKLHHLRRLDDRIEAHLDGLMVAGPDGWKVALAALESPREGEVFTVAVLALHARDDDGLDKLLSVAETLPAAFKGVVSAFGWVSTRSLRGVVSSLLASANPFCRRIGLASCLMHGVDPGTVLDRSLADLDSNLRALSFRVAGELGRRDLLRECLEALASDDAKCRYQAARSSLLLGDRSSSITTLHELALSSKPHQSDALSILLKVTSAAESRSLLAALSTESSHVRSVIRGVGMAGDPHYIPWLIGKMSDLKLARLAGESFSLVMGLDLAYLDLEGRSPVGVEPSPSDDPTDDNVALDEDENLPWPDAEKISAWWQSNGMRFMPGSRYFMGEIPTPESCRGALRAGFQRQRRTAAEYLSLLVPGAPLFNTLAPAWRQQRLLGIDTRRVTVAP